MTLLKSSWTTRPLGDLLEVQNGFAFDSELFSEKSGTPLIRIRDLKDGIDTACRFNGPYDPRFVVKAGDYLIGMDGEFKCYKWRGVDALLNQRVCRLINFDIASIEPAFLFWGINAHLKKIEDETPYVTVKHLSSRKLLGVNFAFPPLHEQRRIVARIKECMERVEEIERLRAEAVAQRDFLLESVIEAAIDKEGGRPVALADVCAIASPLVDPSQSLFRNALHVGGANIESSTGRLFDLKTSEQEKLKSSKFPFDSRMVLYNKIRPYLRKVARPEFAGI